MWIAGNWHGLGLHASPVPSFIIKNEKKIGQACRFFKYPYNNYNTPSLENWPLTKKAKRAIIQLIRRCGGGRQEAL